MEVETSAGPKKSKGLLGAAAAKAASAAASAADAAGSAAGAAAGAAAGVAGKVPPSPTMSDAGQVKNLKKFMHLNGAHPPALLRSHPPASSVAPSAELRKLNQPPVCWIFLRCSVFASTEEADRLEHEQDQKNREMWFGILHPDTGVSIFYNQVHIFFLLYMLAFLPVRTAFQISPGTDEWAFWADLVIDIAIMFDIFLNFR